MLITFSGLDGAGKSTLIDFLSTALERQRRPVVVLHLNDQVGIYAYLRALRDHLLRRPATRLPPGVADPRSHHIRRPPPRGLRGLAARVRGPVLRSVRRVLYPLDLLVFVCYRAYLEKARGRVLIMDRYFYDTLVDVFNGRNRLWTRFLERITPMPTVPVFLDISPEESYRRKGEFTVEYLRRRYEAYQALFARVPRLVRIANDDLDATKAALLHAVGDRAEGK